MYKLLNLKPIAHLTLGLNLHLLFNILPGQCEFQPPNRGKNFRRRAPFFGGGYIERENFFKHSKGVL